MERTYPVLTVTDKAARALRGGHPWVYGEEVLETHGGCVDGGIVDVQARSGQWYRRCAGPQRTLARRGIF